MGSSSTTSLVVSVFPARETWSMHRRHNYPKHHNRHSLSVRQIQLLLKYSRYRHLL